ncbi:MAG: PQQ-binding-like beta-propeller repeat protein [Pirellulaceae bacterium]
MIRTLLLGDILLLAASSGARAEVLDSDQQWPNWRGPMVNGTAPEAKPPVKWSATENVAWKTEIPGKGSGSPIIWNDRVYLLTAVEVEGKSAEVSFQETEPNEREEATPRRRGPRDAGSGGRGPRGGRGGLDRGGDREQKLHQFTVVCLDKGTGEIVWKQVAIEAVPHEAGHGTNSHASASPITDGKHLYAYFGSRGIYCYDMKGNLKWKRDLGQMQTRSAFGEGGTPALHGNKLVVPWDHEGESFVATLDAETGEVLWKTARDEVTTWATPLIVSHNDMEQVIMNGTNRVRSYNLADGELLWECGGQATNPIPTPIHQDGVVYVMTGYRGYAVYAISLDSRGDVTNDDDKIIWSRTDAGPYIASPVLYEGNLYFTKARDGIVYSVNAKTGEPVFGPERMTGLGTLYASPVAADGKVYFTSRDGKTKVLQHGSEYQVLADNDLGEGVDASPALSGSQMFIRGEKHLFCLKQKE